MSTTLTIVWLTAIEHTASISPPKTCVPKCSAFTGKKSVVATPLTPYAINGRDDAGQAVNRVADLPR